MKIINKEKLKKSLERRDHYLTLYIFLDGTWKMTDQEINRKDLYYSGYPKSDEIDSIEKGLFY